MKICGKCKQGFPATNIYFNNDKSRKDGLYSYCRKCHTQCTKDWLKDNLGRNKQRKIWEASIDGIWSFLKGRAKLKSFEFKLTKIEMAQIISTPCEYCGKLQEKLNGVDRVDSNKGYTKENSVSCCAMCNYMKNKYQVDEFKEHVNKIHQWQLERASTP